MLRKPTLLCAIAVLCLLLAGLGFTSSSEPPWVERVGDGVLRVNSSLAVMAAARNAIIDQHQNLVDSADGTLTDPTYQRSGQCWKGEPQPNRMSVEISRARTQVTDQNHKTLSIEQIASSGAPTLVFITYDGPGGGSRIASELVQDLERRGVSVR